MRCLYNNFNGLQIQFFISVQSRNQHQYLWTVLNPIKKGYRIDVIETTAGRRPIPVYQKQSEYKIDWCYSNTFLLQIISDSCGQLLYKCVKIERSIILSQILWPCFKSQHLFHIWSNCWLRCTAVRKFTVAWLELIYIYDLST